MVGDSYKYRDIEQGALPEARKTKQHILEARRNAKNQLLRFNRNPYYDQFKHMRSAVLSYYYEVRPHLKILINNDLDYYDLLDIGDRPKQFNSWKEVEQEDKQFYLELYERLEEAVYDLNLTNISVNKNNKPYGYEFLSGLDHSMSTGRTGFKRLKENLKHMRQLLRKDTDLVGMIWGGNRTGKTTLSLICCDYVQYGENKWELPQDHMVFNDDDFNNSLDSHPRYSAEHIDEMSLLFHKKDSMNTDQKNRNKKLKTYAKKNMFLLGCDNNFYNIDNETINDKIDFAIHVPERGRFEFYSKAKIKQFEKGDKGEPETPKPDFKGRFPDLSSHEQGSKLWERYKEVEDKKLEVGDEDDQHDPERKAEQLESIAEQVVEDPEDYIKELEGRDPIIADRIIRVKHGISENDAKAVKDLVENQLDLSEYNDS